MDNIYIKSKKLAYLLRHSGRTDEYGYMNLTDIVVLTGFTKEEIDEIVKNDWKGRYEYSADNSRIKALSGHSVRIDMSGNECTPPDILYHGTASCNIKRIMKEGLHPKSRQYVHLSNNPDTAAEVGKRHGKPIVLKVDAVRMSMNGHVFYIANNGTWLTENVPPAFILSM